MSRPLGIALAVVAVGLASVLLVPAWVHNWSESHDTEWRSCEFPSFTLRDATGERASGYFQNSMGKSEIARTCALESPAVVACDVLQNLTAGISAGNVRLQLWIPEDRAWRDLDPGDLPAGLKNGLWTDNPGVWDGRRTLYGLALDLRVIRDAPTAEADDLVHSLCYRDQG